MTESDSSLDPFLELEINEHHAALMRQIVVVVTIIAALLVGVGLHH